MPKFEKRFARQHIYEPPPEFPLASPYSGIVHHLSGPTARAPTQTTLARQRRSAGGDAAHRLLFAPGLGAPGDSRARWTPWSVFQDGSIERATRRGGAGPAPAGRAGARGAPMRPPGHPAPHGRPRPRHACAAGGPSRARAGDSREGIRRARAPRSSASLPTVSGTCHSLSKVLVTFPSRYLFAIGLPDVRSLGWDSPPDWGCTPKQPDSPEPPRAAGAGGGHGIVTLSDAAPQRTSPPRPAKSGPGTPQLAERAIPGVGSARFARRYSGRPRSFLFLRLVICLSSAGGLVGRQVNSGAARSRARGRPPPGTARPPGAVLRRVRAARASRGRSSQPGGRTSRAGEAARAGAACVPPSTLTPACSRPKPRAPCAFEDSMVHVGLQFTTHIAFRGVLHRPGSRGIHRRKLWHFRMNMISLAAREGRRGTRAAPPVATGTVWKPPSNDPSAGSPTETLLRLLHHLGDRVQPVSRRPRRAAVPLASPGRPICRSDGRCVQRAGT